MTSERRLAQAEKRRRALELRKAGASYEQIAESLGYRSKSGAHDAVTGALRDMLREPAEQVRTLELSRLDDILMSIWTRVRAGEVAAIDRALRLAERRARLLGLDAPVKVAPTDPSGEVEYGGFNDEQRAERIAALLDRARARRAGLLAGTDLGGERVDGVLPVDSREEPGGDSLRAE